MPRDDINPARRAARVLPDSQLWLSGKDLSTRFGAMQALGIKRIVACGCEPTFPAEFQYMHVRLRDHAEAKVSLYLDPAADFIHAGLQAGEGVLVHCHAGICRSSTMVIAYLLKHRRDALRATTLPDALELLRRSRPAANPRPEFRQALERFADRMRTNDQNDPNYITDDVIASRQSLPMQHSDDGALAAQMAARWEAVAARVAAAAEAPPSPPLAARARSDHHGRGASQYNEAAMQQWHALGVRAAAAAKLGHLDEAAALFEESAAVRPDWPKGYLCAARAHKQRGDDAAAVDALTRGIAACPGSWSGILRAELPAFDMRARAVHDARDMGLGADVSSGSGTIQAPG
jgi:hypothetical protein